MTLPFDTLQLLLERDLQSLKREIEAYPNDASVWATPAGISNSAGSLALHVAGNIQHFIGACLGKTGYVRDRPAEFARRDVPRTEILAELDRALAAVRATFTTVTPESVPAAFPDLVAGRSVESGDFLIHLVAHLGYHVGQIDYHRRITTGVGTTVDTVPVSALRERTA